MPRILPILTALLLSTPAVTQAQQAVNTWSDAFAPAGIVGYLGHSVTALAESNDRIYVGGDFYLAGPHATNLAAFDTIAEEWISVGNVAGGLVQAIASSDDGVIYVGGTFSSINGVPLSRIAGYDPQTDEWFSLGEGVNGDVRTLAVSPSGDLYAGGSFSSASGVAAQRIARWDGEDWHTLEDSGIQGNVVGQMIFHGEILYVAGHFNSVGGVPTQNVARFDTGSMTWSGLGGGVSGVSATGITANEMGVFVGGYFNMAIQPDGSTLTVNNVARWDSISEQWCALGGGSDPVDIIGSGPDGNVYIAMHESDAAGVLQRWDGSVWHAVVPRETEYNKGRLAFSFLSTADRLAVGFGLFFAVVDRYEGVSTTQLLYWYEPEEDRWGVYGSEATAGMTDEVFVLAAGPDAGTVYAGGTFRYAGTQEVDHVAYWNGASWEPLGRGVRMSDETQMTRVNVLHYSNSGMVYVGGDFHEAIQTDGTTVTSRRVALWDRATGTWHALGGGVNSYVQAIIQLPDGTVYVGGQFTQATQTGGEALPVSRLVVWNTATEQWETPPGDHGFTMVFAMAVDESGALIIAGRGPDGGRVARLDPNSQEWMELRVWSGNTVNDLAVFGNPGEDGVLYAAVDPGGIWQWENNIWTQLGGFGGALTVSVKGDPRNGGELYAGGWKYPVHWVSNVRRLQGSTWYEVGGEFYASSLRATAVGLSEAEDQVAVWIGGVFAQVPGGILSVNIARWETINHGPINVEASPSEQDIALHVYPNPAIDRITIAYKLPIAMDARLIVYDLLGRRVAVLHEGSASSSETLSIDISGLSAGTYILRLADPDGRSHVTRRFTVVR